MDQRNVERLVRYLQKAGDRETGGILIGNYSDDLDQAVITKVTGPPRDSRAGRTFFVRGTRGLQQILDRLWRDGSGYYLGEWHFHPTGDGAASGKDFEQMEKLSWSTAFYCPEPILLIVAGSMGTAWAIRAFIYPEGHQVEMEAVADPDIGAP